MTHPYRWEGRQWRKGAFQRCPDFQRKRAYRISTRTLCANDMTISTPTLSQTPPSWQLKKGFYCQNHFPRAKFNDKFCVIQTLPSISSSLMATMFCAKVQPGGEDPCGGRKCHHSICCFQSKPSSPTMPPGPTEGKGSHYSSQSKCHVLSHLQCNQELM